MSSLLKGIRNFVGRVAWFDIEMIGKRSIAIVDQKFRKHAWSSQRGQLRSLIEELEIDVVIDVGANEGQFAQQIREFYSGTIHSFEPVSSAFEQLSKVANSDQKWHIYNFALGREQTRKTINVSNTTVFSSLLTPNDFSSHHFGDISSTKKEEVIEVRRLDDVLDAIMPDVKKHKVFLKMDTQGYDLEVFRGLGSKCKYIRALQSEISLIPIYKNMPHWTESVLEYEASNFRVAGMFPVSRNSWSIIEYDCLMVATNYLDI